MKSQKAYGVTERNPEPNSALDFALEQVSVRGFGVVPAVLDGETVRDLNERLDAVYEQQCAEVGGEAKLAAIGDADIVRLPLAYDSTFLDLALNEVIVVAARRLLGSSVVLMMQNGVINRPDREQAQTAWHRDLNYQHFISSRPLAMSAMVCLEDFTEETGGTVFAAATHLTESMPSDALLMSSAETPEAKAGSIVLFNSMVFHRTGANNSKRIRRGINHVVGIAQMGQVIDIPRALQRPQPQDSFAAGYLGYRWNPVPSVAEWRFRKIKERAAS